MEGVARQKGRVMSKLGLIGGPGKYYPRRPREYTLYHAVGRDGRYWHWIIRQVSNVTGQTIRFTESYGYQTRIEAAAHLTALLRNVERDTWTKGVPWSGLLTDYINRRSPAP